MAERNVARPTAELLHMAEVRVQDMLTVNKQLKAMEEAEAAEAEAQESLPPVPCDMHYAPPMDFAWCETHDETFPLGSTCAYYTRKDGTK